MSVHELLDDLAHLPRLPGAACVQHRDIFDAARDAHGRDCATRNTAAGICADCPALAACRSWLHSLAPGARRAA
jgi:WhiB family redox-sensing transcriptional regulator